MQPVCFSCYRNTVPFFIIYFIVEATETNVCASLESHSSVSTSTSPAWQLTQQNASLFHWGWHCQQCSKGICQDGVLANDVVFIGQGFKANQRHHLVALWNHATAIQAGYQATLTTSTVTVDITIGWSSLSIVLYNFKLLYPVYMFHPMYSWRTMDFSCYTTPFFKKTELHLPLRRLRWPCSNGFWWLLTPQPPIVHGTIAGSWYFGSTDSKHWCFSFLKRMTSTYFLVSSSSVS